MDKEALAALAVARAAARLDKVALAMAQAAAGLPDNDPTYHHKGHVLKVPCVRGPVAPRRTGIAGFFDDCFVCAVGSCLTGCLYGENYQKIYGYGFACACMM